MNDEGFGSSFAGKPGNFAGPLVGEFTDEMQKQGHFRKEREKTNNLRTLANLLRNLPRRHLALKAATLAITVFDSLQIATTLKAHNCAKLLAKCKNRSIFGKSVKRRIICIPWPICYAICRGATWL